MNLKKIELNELSKKIDPIMEMRDNWYLVTAEHNGTVNALTGGWGTFGNLWEKKVITVYIRPQRHTKKFIDASGKFTLTFFDGHQKEMGFIGSNSGADVPDKIAKSGLNLTRVEGQPTYEEGKIVILCKTIYTQQIQPENFIEKGFGEQTYPDKDYSVMYVAEIVDAYEM
jgi:Conserved protein/domain typically associated with flavoprotein oxygenases, DIM6/NTAB family